MNYWCIFNTINFNDSFISWYSFIFFTLAGFTAVYDNPEGISIEELNQATSTENVLEQVLQDRANQLREEMEGGEAAPADGAVTEEAPAEAAPAQ